MREAVSVAGGAVGLVVGAALVAVVLYFAAVLSAVVIGMLVVIALARAAVRLMI